MTERWQTRAPLAPFIVATARSRSGLSAPAAIGWAPIALRRAAPKADGGALLVRSDAARGAFRRTRPIALHGYGACAALRRRRRRGRRAHRSGRCAKSGRAPRRPSSALRSRSVVAAGVITFSERSLAMVQARAAGFVERTYGRAVGDVVRAGAPIVDVRVPEWTAAQAEYLALRGAGGDLAHSRAPAPRHARHASFAHRTRRARGRAAPGHHHHGAGDRRHHRARYSPRHDGYAGRDARDHQRLVARVADRVLAASRRRPCAPGARVSRDLARLSRRNVFGPHRKRVAGGDVPRRAPSRCASRSPIMMAGCGRA
jgi:hypothetical protein